MSPRTNNALSMSGRAWRHPPRFPQTRQRLVIVASLSLIFICAVSLLSFSSSPSKAQAQGGTGATLPYVEMEAHSATTNGTILGPSYTLGNLADDAVDHQAVQLPNFRAKRRGSDMPLGQT